MQLFSVLYASFKATALTGFFITILFSCNSTDSVSRSDAKPKAKKYWAVSEPVTDRVLHFNDSLKIKLDALKKDLHADSTQVFIEGKKIHSEIQSPVNFSQSRIFSKVGRQDLRIRVFFNDSLSQTLSTRITVLSDVEPLDLNYKLLRTFEHSTESFTQGYIYRKNAIYEGTGRKNRSQIQKIDPLNGKVLKEIKMDANIFGEGITEINGKLYQLTYQNKLGFVYDLNSFEKLYEFELQTYEGWGLTNDSENLIVSEGSSILYFYHRDNFTQVRQLDVCNNIKLVTSLNELEYSKGAIWANVYGKQYIIKIDAKTGKHLASVDLSDLYPANIPQDYDHVMNGIAYNPDNDSFFITGKLWPIVYEIRILE